MSESEDVDDQLPKGWKKSNLGEVCEKPQYGWTTKAAREGSVRLLRTTDLTHGPITWATVPYCDEIPDDLAKYRVQADDIFISRAGSVGVSVHIRSIDEVSVFASYLIRIRCGESIDPCFMKFFLDSPAYWLQINDMSAGVALANINATKLKELDLPLPPLTEQEQIVEILGEQLSRLDAALGVADAIEKRSAALRRSLLHTAFTGRLTEKWRESVHV